MREAASRAWALLAVALLLGLTGVASVTEGGAWTALPRVALAAVVLLVLPGLLLLRRFDPFPDARDPLERGALALGLSWVVLTAVTALVTFAELDVRAAALAIGAACLALAAGPPRATSAPPATGGRRGVSALLVGLVAVVATYAWRAEPPVMGEEMVELISGRKLLGAPAITLTNALHRPDVIPTYILTPYYLLVALMTKLSGLPLFAAYAKLRAVYVLAAFVALHALAHRLSGSRALARATLLAVLLLLFIDPDPWTWPAGLLPLHRRGAFAASVLLPVLLLFALHATRPATRGATGAGWTAALLLSLTMTHALESIFALFFLGGLLLRALALGDAAGRRRAALVLGAALGVMLAYRFVHGRLVLHVVAYEAARRTGGLGDALRQLLGSPISSLVGGAPEGGRYLIGTCGAVCAYFALGVLGLPALASRRRALGATLLLATAPALLLFATPFTFDVLRSVTSPEVIFGAGYFGLLGTIGWVALASLARDALARACERRAHPRRDLALASAAAGLALAATSWAALLLVTTFPALFALGVAAAGAWVLRPGPHAPVVFAVGVEVDRPRDADRWSHLAALLLLLLPTFALLKRFPGHIEGSTRESLPARWARHDVPPALDWPAYYPHLQETTRPRVELPRAVVEGLERVLVPRQVVIYDPPHSMTIPLLLDQYIVNPGFLLSSDMEYFERWVQKDEAGRELHPLYDDEGELTDREREFLGRFEVRYVIASPAHRAGIERKLAADPARYRRIFDQDGYAAWEVVARR